jgi:hypothetical protein
MSDQVWYEVDALTADLTSRRYRVLATSEEGAERKMRAGAPQRWRSWCWKTAPRCGLPLSRGDGSGRSR